MPLLNGETLHAGIEAQCSWFGPADVTYSQQRLLVFGSTPSLAVSATASAIGNHRRRRSATAMAAARWRNLGPTQILLTSHRLLIEIDRDLRSLPLSTIIDLTPTADLQQVTITVTDGTALSLHDNWTRYLAIALRETLRSAGPGERLARGTPAG